ncbi:hypothetical protein AURDEDRAFT_165466 [Auricularia subglabra TFB-10046 SS5]|nr:hypothetical protein AURDEDRAFT_165466 [Auricularia subglabra TFB-10046 SS5]
MPSLPRLTIGFLLVVVGQSTPLHGLTKHPRATRGDEPHIEVGLNASSVSWSALASPIPSSPGSPSLRVTVSNSPEAAFTTARNWYDFDFDEYPDISLSYAVYFPEDFDFSHGGRLPGIVGGAGNAARICLTGLPRLLDVSQESCFALHPAWRSDGRGVVYLAIHPTLGSAIVPGTRSERTVIIPQDNSFRYPRGAWTQLALRVRLNTPGSSDGVLQLWLNGTLLLRYEGLELRLYDSSRFRGVDLAAFSYGPTSPSTQRITLARFTLAALFDNSSTEMKTQERETMRTRGWKSLVGACVLLILYILWRRLFADGHNDGMAVGVEKAA